MIRGLITQDRKRPVKPSSGGITSCGKLGGMEGLIESASRLEEGESSNRKWSAEERAMIARASLKAGATVEAVARQYGVKQWQVYEWRKQVRRAAQQRQPATLLAVQVTEPDPIEKLEPKAAGSVVIEAQRARITITGSVDALLVRTVLECVAR